MYTGKGQFIKSFPSPKQLINKIKSPYISLNENLTYAAFCPKENESLHTHQYNAIQVAIENIAKRKSGILNIAPGTGKTTIIIFQILYKLSGCNWNIEGAERKPRVLFLTEQRIFTEQFARFLTSYGQQDIIADESRQPSGSPTTGHIFIATVQQFSSKKKRLLHYRRYPKDYFDLIVIDAFKKPKNDQNNRLTSILNYFGNALHLKFTNVPETIYSESSDDLLYKYTLADGIVDGFLSPIKVHCFPTLDFSAKLENSNEEFTSAPSESLIVRRLLENFTPLKKTVIYCTDNNQALNICNALTEAELFRSNGYCVNMSGEAGANDMETLQQFKNSGPGSAIVLTTAKQLPVGLDLRDLSNIVICKPIHSKNDLMRMISSGIHLTEGKEHLNIIDFTHTTSILFNYLF